MNYVLIRWSLAKKKLATVGFCRNKIVGEGASAIVHRGSISFGGVVAVKRFDQSNRRAFTRNPFIIEFATMDISHLSYCGVPIIKMDIYNFGVVVLEVAKGKRPVDAVADPGFHTWGKRKLIKAANSRLLRKYNILDMERMLMVGLCYKHSNYEKRPIVKEAARILKGEAAFPLLPSMRPTVTIRSNFFANCEDILNFGGDNCPSGNDAGWLTPRMQF
ncbi:hypothetical protein CRYUN_Cryun28dG0026700 [Craigia yunnanensis]